MIVLLLIAYTVSKGLLYYALILHLQDAALSANSHDEAVCQMPTHPYSFVKNVGCLTSGVFLGFLGFFSSFLGGRAGT